MKKITFILIGLLMISMVTGLLVNYLSNTAEAEVEVSSPISNNVIGNSVFSIYGGETVSLNITTENLASVPITGTVENLVSNPLGLNCSDFTTIQVTTYTNGTYVGSWELIGLGNCIIIDNTTVEFLFGPQPTTWSIGQIDEMEINVSFPSNAFGTYTLTSQVLV